MDEPSLGNLMRGLLAAQEAGDEQLARSLRVEVVTGLMDARARNPSRVFSSNEFVLLRCFSRDLLGAGLDAQALRVLEAAREFAATQAADSEQCATRLEEVRLRVDRLDLTGAVNALEAMLGTPPGDAEALLAAAGALAPADVNEKRREGLRVRTLYAVGRVWAAEGALGRADRALRLALELQERAAEPTVSTAELALLLAEVRLDRGDFEGFEALRGEREARDTSREARVQWRFLSASLLYLRARLSEADAELKAVLQGPQPLSLRRTLDAARWLRANVLAALNRLDAAEALVAELIGSGGAPGLDTRQLLSLLDARRSFARGLGRLPNAGDRDAVAPAAPFDALPRRHPGSAAAFQPGRIRERARDEWTLRANELLLALHEGSLEWARGALAHLLAWSERIDSKLIPVQRQQLEALVAYYGKDDAAAKAQAGRAMEGYRHLGLGLKELEACEVRLWAARRLDAGDPELPALVERAKVLRDAFELGLEPTDRVLALLNKWSTVDGAIAQWCGALRASAPSGKSPPWRRWVEQRRFRQRSRDTASAILREKRWPSPSGAAPEPPAPEGPGALRAAERQAAFARSTRPPEPALESLPAWALPGNTAVLSYVVLPDRVELFLMLSSGCELVPIERHATRLELWDAVRDAQRHLSSANSWKDVEARPRRLPALAEMLGLPEVLARLPSRVTRLCVIPDDVVFHAPFCALPVLGAPLIRRFSISFLPVPGWSARPPDRRPRTALAVAVERTSLGSYPPVPGADQHLEALERLSLGKNLTRVTHPVTREEVAGHLARVELAHFVCHGEYRFDAPHDSGLALTHEWLSVAQLRRIPMDGLELVMLGACWGADTTVLPGREMISLPAAFLSQGARRAIAALWELASDASAHFASDFYGRMERMDPVEALAETQRQWLLETRPKHWAGYVAYVRALSPRAPARWLLGLRSLLPGDAAATRGAAPAES